MGLMTLLLAQLLQEPNSALQRKTYLKMSLDLTPTDLSDF